jgi:hypothetical protein
MLADEANCPDYPNDQYSDPYNQQQQYPQSSNDHSYDSHPVTQPYDYSRGAAAASPLDPSCLPTAYPATTTYPPAAAGPSSGSSGFYPNPHDNQRVSGGAYDGYDDDGTDPGALGAIGLMAQSNGGRQGGDYTGAQGPGGGYSNNQLVQPRPQHLADQRDTAEILRHNQSPMSPESDIGRQRGMIVGDHGQQQQQQYGYGQGSDEGYGGEAPPPSYVAGGQARPVVPEKAGYRPGQ